jgi:predicted extracellular nuclease
MPLPAQVVISQVYGGGGNSGATYRNDYIELFNRGTATASLSGMSLQYASATGTGNFGASSSQLTVLSGSIPPGGYFLVQEASGGSTGILLPTPDLAGGAINMSATAGKVALANTTTTLGCNGGSAPCNATQLALIVDLIGYGTGGSGANFCEPINTGTGTGCTAPAPTISATTADFRAANGCTDSNNNTADFAAAAAAPRNSASPINACAGSTNPSGSGSADPNPVTPGFSTTLSATITPGANPDSTGLAVACDLTGIGGSGSFSLAMQTATTFSSAYLVPAGTAANTYSLPCTIGDAQGRSGAFNIGLTVSPPPPTFHNIYEITGSGTSSPLAGQAVSTRGVVTAIRAATSSVRGFYIEALPADRDSDVNTSEGVLIFTGSSAPPACVAVGNSIQFNATVSDFVPSTAPVGSVPLTELVSPSGCSILDTNQLGNLPPAVSIDAGNPLIVGGSATQSRKYLSMRVQVPNATVVGPALGNLTETSATSVPNGQLFVTLPGVPRPLHTDPGILATRRPSDAAATVPSWNGQPEVLRVDVTGLSPAGTPYEVTTGATIAGLSGVMDYNTSQGQYQLYTDAPGAGTPNPALPTLSATPVPLALSSDLTIGSFNMERFYNDINENNGAVVLTTTAYHGRLQKASLAIRNVMRMPDIIGLEEVEGQQNSPGSTPVPVIQDIVNQVNADAIAAGQGNPNYAYCPGFVTNDPSAIIPAIIYKQDKVQLTSCVQYGVNTQYTEPGGTTNILNDRPPITLAANVKATGSDSALPVRLLVNHLRSLSGIDQPGTSNGDRVRAKRNEQAKYVGNLISGTGDQPTNWNATDNLVIVGDFNAYQVNDGYVDVINCIAGNPPAANTQYFTSAEIAVSLPCTPLVSPTLSVLTNLNPAALYSYSFSGAAQTIDHVLLNTKVGSRFRQIAYARNDADFSEGPTYRNDFTRPERVSDHDMPVLYLNLPVEVTSRTHVNAGPVVFNRGTQRYTSVTSVTNTGTTALNGPIYLFFKNLPAGVTLPDLPQYNGVPYATFNVSGGLAPGATTGTIIVSFSDPSNVRITYTPQTFDGSF